MGVECGSYPYLRFIILISAYFPLIIPTVRPPYPYKLPRVSIERESETFTTGKPRTPLLISKSCAIRNRPPFRLTSRYAKKRMGRA